MKECFDDNGILFFYVDKDNRSHTYKYDEDGRPIMHECTNEHGYPLYCTTLNGITRFKYDKNNKLSSILLYNGEVVNIGSGDNE